MPDRGKYARPSSGASLKRAPRAAEGSLRLRIVDGTGDKSSDGPESIMTAAFHAARERPDVVLLQLIGPGGIWLDWRNPVVAGRRRSCPHCGEAL